MSARKKLLIVDIAALGLDQVSDAAGPLRDLRFRKLDTVFPAVTCTAQASFRTGLWPRDHGLVANGLYFRELGKVLFWEQAASLVQGERIWKAFREQGRRVGLLFWQQSLGEQADLVLSPKPIHKHSGGMIQDCYSQPADLYEKLVRKIGRPFNLMHYWGPLASRKSSDWIVAALVALLDMPDLAPDLVLGYLPHLDYDLQRHGPGSEPARTAREVAREHLSRLRDAAAARGYDYLFFGDYAMGAVNGGPVFPNRLLYQSGLMKARAIQGRLYPDFFDSRAFAVVDHEVAHVFSQNLSAMRQAAERLRELPGVGQVLEGEGLRQHQLDHPRSGELVLVAEEGHWFAYPWWNDRQQAPDYATHVDIHNKPGYDPCELFFGWPPLTVSLDARRIRGSHGRTGPGRETAWASSCEFESEPGNLVELARAVQSWLRA